MAVPSFIPSVIIYWTQIMCWALSWVAYTVGSYNQPCPYTHRTYSLLQKTSFRNLPKYKGAVQWYMVPWVYTVGVRGWASKKAVQRSHHRTNIRRMNRAERGEGKAEDSLQGVLGAVLCRREYWQGRSLWREYRKSGLGRTGWNQREGHGLTGCGTDFSAILRALMYLGGGRHPQMCILQRPL